MKTAHWVLLTASLAAISGGAAAVVYMPPPALGWATAETEEGVTAITWDDLIPAPTTAELLAQTMAGIAPPDEYAPRFTTPGLDAPMTDPRRGGSLGMVGLIDHTVDTTPAAASGLVSAYNGETVRLSGYVVPLDFNGETTSRFLLVPFVGACIHVPPPPPNQIVYVETSEPYPLSEVFEAVTVRGEMMATAEQTQIAEVGYTMTLSRVRPYEAS